MKTNTKKGLVFIPDISGFTELVRNTDLVTGQIITQELLSTIIRHNKLQMEIAEIEGDAVFFFNMRSIPTADELYEQFEIMKAAFDEQVIALGKKYNLALDLHLKAIAHYGEMTEFPIAGFHKLYGEVVIEAHRLLKNNVPARSYLLITDELMAIAKPESFFPASFTHKLCELYGGLRNLCFTYILSTPQFI
ncbi:DUF2652 domain-containing protein [Chitinophaga parva]|uniref:DUF2652 domain-containing protein n=1 Tax=Chitinophaga parva TaxID=2169414 RepID=A0A2T7BF77_9BACT|nr:DUF2652 domain-containing protein [Chitinophaga parva]PUZ24942.1 DUF2652 domain-containing protein [Chitinophaga parva]